MTALPERPYEFYALRGTGGRVILSSTDHVIRTVPGLLDGGTESRVVLEIEAPFSITDVMLLDSASGAEMLVARTVATGASQERIYVIRPDPLTAMLIADVRFDGACTAPPTPGTQSAPVLMGTHVVGALFSVCTDAIDQVTDYTYEVSFDWARDHEAAPCSSASCLRTIDVRYEVRVDEDGNWIDGPGPFPTLAENVGRGIAFQQDDGSIELLLRQVVLTGLHETPANLANVYTCRERACSDSRELGPATWVQPARPFRAATGIGADESGELMTIMQADSLRTLRLPALSRIVTSRDVLFFLRPEESRPDSYRNVAERVTESGEGRGRYSFAGWGSDEEFFAWTVVVPPGDAALVLAAGLPAAPPYRLYELPGS